VDEVAILHHFGEQEAVLEVVEATTALDIHVVQFSKSRTDASGAVDSDERIPGPFLVRCVTSGPISVVETLNNLRSENIHRRGDVETCLVIECLLVSRWWRVSGVICRGGVGDPSELFGSDSCGILGVGIFTPIYKS